MAPIGRCLFSISCFLISENILLFRMCARVRSRKIPGLVVFAFGSSLISESSRGGI